MPVRIPLGTRRRRRSTAALTGVLAVALGSLLGGCAGAEPLRHPVTTGGASSVLLATSRCDWAWPAPAAGRHAFTVRNASAAPARALLVDAASGAIYAQLTTLAPGTSRLVEATLPAGRYRWRCIPLDGSAIASAARTVRGTLPTGMSATVPLYPLSAEEINDAVDAYRGAV